MSAYKNIAIAGASGALGSPVFKTLVDSGKFNIKVLRRIGSSAVFPEGTNVVDVDYSSVEALTAALQGQDALVSTVGSLQIALQSILIDAAIAAGVKRILPSEFGSDLDVDAVRALPVFGEKVKIQDLAIEKAKTTPLTYTFVYNGAFLDWGLEHKFLIDLTEGKPTIFDGGDVEFSTTSLASVGDAVVGVLTHPEETKNRSIRVHDTVLTQNKFVALAKEVAPEKTFTPVDAKVDDLVALSNKRLAEGDFSMGTFAPYLFRAIFSPAGKYNKTDNELLGIKGKTDADVKDYIKQFQLQ